MVRLEFLERARALAQQQCVDSSCLPVAEYEEIQKAISQEDCNEEEALYKKAHEILVDASFDAVDSY